MSHERGRAGSVDVLGGGPDEGGVTPREDRALRQLVAGALLVTLWGLNHSCTD